MSEVSHEASFETRIQRRYTYTAMAIVPEAKAYLIANSVVALITVVVVALRVVSRILAGSKLGWDDYFTLLAVPQGIALLVIQGLCKYWRRHRAQLGNELGTLC